MQDGPAAPRYLKVPVSRDSKSQADELRTPSVFAAPEQQPSPYYRDMPTPVGSELQRSPQIPAPASAPASDLLNTPTPMAIQYSMMLKAQSDREAAEAFRRANRMEEKKKKNGCTLF